MRFFAYLFLSMIMLQSIELTAQGNYFTKAISTGSFFSQAAQKIVRMADNNYFVMGSCDWGGICGSDASGALIDSSGNLLWAFYYDHNFLGDNFFDAVATPDSGVIIVGSSELNLPSPITPVILIMKLNSSGNVVWCKTDSVCQGCNEIFGLTITPLPDGNFIIQSKKFDTPGIYKITPSGNLIWYKEHSVNAFDVFQTIDAVPYTSAKTISVLSSINSPNGIIVTYDSSGNVPSLYDIIIPSTTFQPNSISVTNDGGFIIAGNMNPFSGTDSIAIIKTDSLFNVLWSRIFTHSTLSITRAIQMDNGYYYLSCNTTINSDYYSVLIKTDSLGNVINSIISVDPVYCYDILESGNNLMLSGSSGGVLMAAKTDDSFTSICSQPFPVNNFSYTITTAPHLPLGGSGNTPTNWVDHPVTLVQYLNSIDLCINSSLPDAENQFNAEVYPNPVSDVLNITVPENENGISEIILYDIATHKLHEQEFRGSCTVKMESFSKGIYFYEVRYKNEPGGLRVVKKGKIVKD